MTGVMSASTGAESEDGGFAVAIGEVSGRNQLLSSKLQYYA
jgi:hypothetical protein